MTLRLDEEQEQQLKEICDRYYFSTKSKAITEIIKRHNYREELLQEVIEKARKAEIELQQLKIAIKEKFNLEAQIKKLISD